MYTCKEKLVPLRKLMSIYICFSRDIFSTVLVIKVSKNFRNMRNNDIYRT